MDRMIAIRLLSALAVSFLAALFLSPLVITSARRLKVGQPILSYVEQHAAKAGTPTMGGFIFLIPAFLTTLAFTVVEGVTVGLIAASVMISFAVLGFLDDFIKIKTKDNLGLKPYQKIIGQAAIAVIVAIYAYRSETIGSEICLPFVGKTFDLGRWYIPFAAFVFLALSNCVNLTDGLDGLASGCSLWYVIAFAVVTALTIPRGEGDTLILFDCALIGGLFAFLLFNTNPASIFMGDTGSLGLGGALAAIALFSKQPLLIPIVGIMFVVSGISIIMQVIYFKCTHGKRIFLMAPYHHHLEKKGLGEGKICAIYSTVTLLMGILSVISVLVGMYAVSR